MQCGLLGGKLGHSYSPSIHRMLGDYDYQLFEKSPEELESFLKHGNFTGINVTIPYKKEVIPYLSELSDTAMKLGAVNTIVRKPDGSLLGHNTDYFGFLSMLRKSGLQVSGKKVLVLGSGGASATCVCVLQEAGANVVVISRNGENNYSNIGLHEDAAVIVNATPVGMYPKCGETPISLDIFKNLEGVLDLIYNPARTALIMEAEQSGLVTENGLWMLVAQAKESAEWFLGEKIPDDKIQQIHSILQKQMENIILIGMPGCGKSTIGRILAERLNRKFIDADREIERISGITIPEIFASSGEEGFRKIETEVLSQIAKESGYVIATGGGCVTKAENYALLHQNGRIFWLQRDLECLATDGRPLSQAGKLNEMYQIRKPIYEDFADYIVDNNGNTDNTVSAILSLEVE